MVSTNKRPKRVFWQGTVTLKGGGLELRPECRVVQRSQARAGDVVVECEDVSLQGALVLPGSDSLILTIPGVSEPLEMILTDSSWNSDGVARLILAPTRSPVWFSRSRDLRSGRFVLINFAQYWMGSPLKLGFELKAERWTAHFLPVSEKTLEISEWIDNDDYRITHEVEFSRVDGSSFTAEDAQDFLWKLSLFLSFCRGQWVGCSLTVALDSDGEIALEQWGTGRVSRWREPSGWLDEHHGEAICNLYETFWSRLNDESWRDAIHHVVYWFTRADTNYVGPDGACILLQAILERLAWHVLVRERHAISEKRFKDITAADQLRLMLNMLSVPSTIPDGLTTLKTLGTSRSFDGPEAFTYIRNRLTHPPKLSAKKEALPVYEAYCLGKWYVELAILSACGFVGEYGNRTVMRRWKGQVEKVPWA